MNNNDPPPGKRKKIVPKCPNPLFVYWLKELRDDAADKGIKTQYTYGKVGHDFKFMAVASYSRSPGRGGSHLSRQWLVTLAALPFCIDR